jgi:hypothetical protein
MTPRQLHRLFIAPEIIVVDLALAALVALERVLRLEHPLLDAPPRIDHPPTREHADHVLRRARRLRTALRRYRCAVRDLVLEAEQESLPF